MTRILFFFTAMAAMIAAMTAVLIRAELAYPGISPLFAMDMDTPDGQKFSTTAITHILFCYLAVTLLGTTMASAARTRGAPLARLIIALGVVFGFAITALIVLAEIPVSPPTTDANRGVGWVLYPPLSTANPQSALDYLMGFVGVAPMFYITTTHLLIVPATGLLFLGAYAMLATQTGFRWMGYVGAILTVVVLAFASPNLLEVDMPYGTIGLIIIVLPFIGPAAIRMVDDGPAWLFLLTFGAVVTTVAQIVILSLPGAMNTADTVAAAAILYTFPLGLAWYALPAMMMFHSGTRLPEWGVWAISAAITAGLALWLVPMIELGLNGMALHYVDYPGAFAAQNQSVTSGAAIFLMLYLAIIVIVRRSRARPGLPGPAKA